MEIKINYELFNNCFCIPSEVAEKHLKFASHAQLKVLIFVLKFGVDELSADKLEISENELKEAILYWKQSNIFVSDDNKAEQKVINAVPVKEHLPDRKQVVQRASESKEIAVLMRQTEVKLGRVLRQNEASTLIYLIDDIKIKPAVLLMLIDYLISQNKVSATYIQKLAIDWVQKGIDSANKAEKEIIRLHDVKSAIKIVGKCFGTADRKASKKEEELAYKWVYEYNFSESMLQLAYDKCINATGKYSIQYISKIIDTWQNSGYKTVQDVESSEKNSKSDTSYDIDLFKQMINEE
ncbi:MAG: DnaD domain protein [Acutalibacteraceae bacterium]|nr:DnaD domain protein [Acutalibacteraceae bacterium]